MLTDLLSPEIFASCWVRLQFIEAFQLTPYYHSSALNISVATTAAIESFVCHGGM